MKSLRQLHPSEVTQLQKNGCSAKQWERIRVAEGFTPQRIQDSRFFGDVTLGANSGIICLDGIERPCGIRHALVSQCQIGDDVLIANIGTVLHNYCIGAGAVIENIGQLSADSDARFGQGTRVLALNEAGGREVTLFAELSAQIAFLQALYRHAEPFQTALQKLIDRAVQEQKSAGGVIGPGARIRNCGTLKNVHVGAGAELQGAADLQNGSIVSCAQDPAQIGAGVIMKEFIVAEGAHINDACVLERVFVGQGVRLGKQFSAENSLFFANCEGFHSEACSIFAGPYTVTHHKSTLLIAGLFSFYNAGSGTNQSNHMYKLGPVHQGIVERGCKTGSFSYLLLESHIPAFSVVIGKHMNNLDIAHFPFSHISDEGGKSMLVPGKNLFSIGTVRDSSKWPARDRRGAAEKRDLICFQVFSPYTVEKMRIGRDLLLKFYDKTPKEEEAVVIGGATIRRLLLRKGAKYYGLAIDRYLLDNVFCRLEQFTAGVFAAENLSCALAAPDNIAAPQVWVDLAGLLAERTKIDQLVDAVGRSGIASLAELTAALRRIQEQYEIDEWAYICQACAQEYGEPPAQWTVEKMRTLLERYAGAAGSLAALTLADAKIEFDDFASIGYGLFAEEEERQKDFQAVRGRMETHPTIQQCETEILAIKTRVEKLAHILTNMSI